MEVTLIPTDVRGAEGTQVDKPVVKTYGEGLRAVLSEILEGSKEKDKLEELTVRLVNLLDKAQSDERVHILQTVLKEQIPLTLKYKALIKHTGGIIESSMGYAYSKAINDIFKLIARSNK